LLLLLSKEPPFSGVMVASTRFSGGNFLRQHWHNPLRLFN
jgi:hypothetical protein